MATSDNTPVFPAFPAFPSSQPLTRRERFNELCPDPSGRINAIQLLQDLKNMDSTDFRLETAGMLIRWYDTDKSGTIDFEEYDKIIGFVEDWKKKFNEADADKSGRIDNLEIKDALDKMGYEVKQEFVDAVMKQQAVKLEKVKDEKKTGFGMKSMFLSKNKPKPKWTINFDEFIWVCAVIRTRVNMYNKLDPKGRGYVKLNRDEFMMVNF